MRAGTVVCLLLASSSAAAEVRDSAAPAEVRTGAHQRSDSWFGITAGSGLGQFRAGGSTTGFADALAGYDPWPLAVSLRGGPTLGERWLAGAELTILREMGSRTVTDFVHDSVTYTGTHEIEAHVQTTTLSVIGVFFPLRTGPFVRGGAGGASLRREFQLPSGSESTTVFGLNGTVGAGWAFWVGDRLNVTLSADASLQQFPWHADGEPDRAAALVGGVGLDWY